MIQPTHHALSTLGRIGGGILKKFLKDDIGKKVFIDRLFIIWNISEVRYSSHNNCCHSSIPPVMCFMDACEHDRWSFASEHETLATLQVRGPLLQQPFRRQYQIVHRKALQHCSIGWSTSLIYTPMPSSMVIHNDLICASRRFHQ